MHRLAPLALPLLLFLAPLSGARGQSQEERPALETRVWLDRGDEPVLQRGDQVRVYYRTSEEAYAAIFRIDTDGVVSMVFPQHPGATAPVPGGRDYRLLFPRTPAWSVEDDPGVGYYFMVASPEPLDFSAFGYDVQRGWDLGSVGSVVYEDPYVAIDDYVAAIVPDWELVPYALDFLTYHVGSTYSYPRFLCYDCHDQRSYTAWNPYSVTCTTFRVVIWDDPYFYPAYRYAGTRVVVARPARALPRYGLVARAPGDIGVRPLVRAREAPSRSVAQFKEAPTVAPSSRVPVRRTPVTTPSGVQAAGASRTGQEAPEAASSRPTLQRRPSSPDARLPVRTPPSGAAQPARGALPARGEPSSAVRGDPRRGGPEAAPSRAPARPVPSGAAPGRAAAPPSARPSAPVRGAMGARPSAPARGATGARPSAPREPTPRSAVPSRASPRGSATAPARPNARPAAPAPQRPSARPSSPPASRPPARAAPAPRAPAPRPTVQPRRGGRGN